MTKLNRFLLACTVCCCITATLPSCTPEVDDYFDQPASQRLAATVSRARQILRSAEHGWELEYYPGSSLAYGGMVYTVKFDSLTATVGCSLIPDSTDTSLYKLTNDNGPVLSFDSYNTLLHYFSTPSSREYEAKGGEFEFVIDSLASDFVRLYGKKTRNTMYLRLLTDSPDDYAQRTIRIHDSFVEEFTGSIDTISITAVASGRRMFFYSSHSEMRQFPDDTIVTAHEGHPELTDTIFTTKDSLVVVRDTTNMAFTFNDKGIRFYRPLYLHGVKMQTFTYDADTRMLTCQDAGNGSFNLEGQPLRDDRMYFPKYEGDYTLTYGSNATAAVHLAPNRLEGTYLMQGLNPKYDLTLRYDAATGDLLLGSQVIGETDGSAIYWSCVNYDNGKITNITTTDEGQFTIHWNGNRFYPRFNITATNPAQNDVNSAVLIYLYYGDNGTLYAGLFNNSEWLTNGSYLFNNLKSLNRKTRLE